SVRDFVRKAFAYVGMELEFQGYGVEEKGYISKIHHVQNTTGNGERTMHYALSPMLIGKCVLEIDPRYFRPTEVDILLGDASKAKSKLGWEPELTLDQLVADMMEADLKLMQREQYLKNGGFNVMNYYE
ncbi:MAG: GDP-mannose 4,6-dehydratase, partial [Bacteroidales bacterium]|nr:GDP-mannose 4,6-dehydratase [Bacteroidales bacterium]